MPLKRRNRDPPQRRGLAPGESLSRYLVPTHNTQPALWAWVGSEVIRESDISTEHCLRACGMSTRNIHPFCANKYVSQVPDTTVKETTLDEEIAIVSDDDIKCSSKGCKGNPNCLNYLGQDKWEDEGIYFRASTIFIHRPVCTGRAMREFFRTEKVGSSPNANRRVGEHPVGLRVRKRRFIVVVS